MEHGKEECYQIRSIDRMVMTYNNIAVGSKFMKWCIAKGFVHVRSKQGSSYFVQSLQKSLKELTCSV